MATKSSQWSKDVKKAVIDQDMTIKQLAETIGYSVATVSQVINGRYSKTTCKVIVEKINETLGMSDYKEGSKTREYQSYVDKAYDLADKVAEARPKEAERVYSMAARYSKKMAEYIEWREIGGEEYIDCKPAYCRKRWYMAGGNFLYSSDSRFKEVTKSKYPISIHDRYEGR